MNGVTAMGVDVSLRRGLDVVVLTRDGDLASGPDRVTPAELRSVIRQTNPGVIAIDGPPAWASSGRSREIERRLNRLGISIYATPSDPAGRSFYGWMEEAFKAFAAAAAAGYPVYRGGPAPGRSSIEVFPHASAVALMRRLPSTGERKVDFRRAALGIGGVGCVALRTQDQVDAALAALTGLRFLEGRACEVGTPDEAVLVMPVPELPVRYARRSS